jgi:hypothetical protein
MESGLAASVPFLVLDRVSLQFSAARNRRFFAAGAMESDPLSQIKQDVFVRPVRWLFGEIARVSQDLRGPDKFIQARSGRYPICDQDPGEKTAIPLAHFWRVIIPGAPVSSWTRDTEFSLAVPAGTRAQQVFQQSQPWFDRLVSDARAFVALPVWGRNGILQRMRLTFSEGPLIVIAKVGFRAVR